MGAIDRILGVAACIALALASCTGSGHATPKRSSTGSPPVTPGPASGWVRKDLNPVTQPAAIGDRFVLYTAAKGALHFMALDARTGKTAWSDAGSTSQIAPGQPPAFVATPSLAIYLRSEGQDFAQLVAVDARDGTTVWHSDTTTFSSWPTICPDDATAVCITGSSVPDPNSADSSLMRYGLTDGSLRSSVTLSPQPGGRELGPDLYDPGTRTPEMIIAASGSSIAWSKPLSSIFTLPRASTDYGWNFFEASNDGLFVGSPGWPPISQTSSRFESDLSRQMTAGFRTRNGSVVWRLSGATFICGYLPCGSINSSFSTPQDVSDQNPRLGIALRMAGTISGSQATVKFTLSKDAHATILGVDLRTGRIAWTFAAGRNEGLISQTDLPPLASLATIVIPDTHGRRVMLDLTNGKTSPLGRSTQVWCRRLVTYKQNFSYPGFNGTKINEYIGQFAVFPCSSDGMLQTLKGAVPSFISDEATADGLAAWSEGSGVFSAAAAA